MVADNDFEALIDLLLLPIATLLDEQENGGKVFPLIIRVRGVEYK